MTPDQVITAARQFHNAVGDDFWSDAELFNHLYFCATRLARDALCIQNRYTAVSVASQQEYEQPDRVISIKRVEYNGRKLDPIDFRQLDSVNLGPNGVAVTGTPMYYYWWDNVLGLHPIPATAGLTIKVYTFDLPSFPSSTTTLEIPTQYHSALVFGVRSLMSPKELGHPNTAYYSAEWEKAVKDVISSERKRKRGDKYRTVQREEDLINTTLGYV